MVETARRTCEVCGASVTIIQKSKHKNKWVWDKHHDRRYNKPVKCYNSEREYRPR